MSVRSDRFRCNESGVSEVLGYIMAFFVSFLVLIFSISTFAVVTRNGDFLAAHAEMQDIASRVASRALQVFEIGTEIRNTLGEVDSAADGPLVYRRSIDVPPEIRGYTFTVAIDPQNAYVNSTDGTIRHVSTTFKAEVVLAPAGGCTTAYVVCEVSGSVGAGRDHVAVTYRYDATVSPVVNSISLG